MSVSAARELAEAVLEALVRQGDGKLAADLVPVIEPVLARALREAERAVLWQVILHLSLELERKSRVGGAVEPLAVPEGPE